LGEKRTPLRMKYGLGFVFWFEGSILGGEEEEEEEEMVVGRGRKKVRRKGKGGGGGEGKRIASVKK
jgi:hypothetical protein